MSFHPNGVHLHHSHYLQHVKSIYEGNLEREANHLGVTFQGRDWREVRLDCLNRLSIYPSKERAEQVIQKYHAQK